MVQNLAGDCLLGTSLIGHHVKTPLPGLQKDRFYHTLSVAVTGQRSLTQPNTSFTFGVEDRSRKIRTTWKATTQPMFQGKVQRKCPTERLCSVQNIFRLATKHLTVTASRIMYTFLHKLFNVLQSKVSPCPIFFSKNNVVGQALEATEMVITIDALKPHLVQSRERDGLPRFSTVLTRTAIEMLACTQTNGGKMFT